MCCEKGITVDPDPLTDVYITLPLGESSVSEERVPDGLSPAATAFAAALRQDLIDDPPMDIGQPEVVGLFAAVS